MRIENVPKQYPAIEKAMQIMRARLHIPLEAERKLNKNLSTEIVYVDDAHVGVDCILVESLSNSLRISTSGNLHTPRTDDENSIRTVPLQLIVDVNKLESSADLTEKHTEVMNTDKIVILVDSSVDFASKEEEEESSSEPEEPLLCPPPHPIPYVNIPVLPRKKRYVMAEKLARRDLLING
mmetsp:Transcript_30124/g.28780  ORF Transcript_30124/g.28780 Transcript_30124/m.28780 type:complete len:181 (-) Transcript_30124:144-686(-)